jgi:imidazolonepropionase
MPAALRNIGALATCRADGAQGDIHVIEDAALVWNGPLIVWAGAERDLPEAYRVADVEDAGGRLVVPGLVDCHTHLAFAGWRAGEFTERALGRSYAEIARGGGGIASTVRQTRAASEGELLERCRGFLGAMMQLGVTAVECKSGYGLNVDDELKLLHVYRLLAEEAAATIVPTFLGAHVVPPEWRDERGHYLALLMDELIPVVARDRLARCCDVFVDDGAFSISEARRILLAAKAAGLGLKLHVDQLSDDGGALLAAEVGALSADHLEHVSSAGIRALAAARVVAVSLPIASLYLRQPPLPARRLIEAGVAVAVATDFNPGSAPSYHLPLALTLACTMQGMTPAEALKGATIVAARAIGLEDTHGSLESGKRADFAVIDAPGVDQWLYHFRPNACVRTVIGGATVWAA